MYQFKPVTERIAKLRQQVRDRVIRITAERSEIVTKSCQENENVVPIIKRPLYFKALCEQMTLLIQDNELIIGNKGPDMFASPAFPEWGSTDWVVKQIEAGRWHYKDGEYRNPKEDGIDYIISEKDFRSMQSVMDYWKDRKVGTMADAWKPDCYDELERLNVSSYVKNGPSLVNFPAGHLIAGYEKIINTGYKALRDQAQSWITEHEGNLMGEDVEKYMFYKSVTIVCDGAITLVKRYAALCAEQAAQCTDPARKKELEQMADSLEWISENPVRNFWEAVQGTALYQVMLAIMNRTPALAIGRFDQYTWPFLKKDLDEGRLTMEQAQEIVDAFFLKLNCFYNAGAPEIVKTTGIGNTYQNVTVGGVNKKTGEDATNPVTFMVFETIGRLKLHDPTIVFRTNKDTPDELWECALCTSKQIGGIPLYYNDDVVIESMINEVGYELEDARDYGCIGCQEIVGSGNDYPAPNGIHPPHASIWWGSVLDMAINDGKNPYNNEQSSLHTGFLYDMKSIEEVRDAIYKMGDHVMRLFITINNYSEMYAQFYAPEALLSMSIEGCMEKGKDVVKGGAKYNSYGGTATGLATLADSIATIKYMCFDHDYCTTRELYDAVMANWEGYEPLRQRILAEVPHFGNNDPYVDEEMNWVVNMYYDICSKLYSTRAKRYKAGLYGASDHVNQGKVTWGTPDGRKHPDPIADAASPGQSRDKIGPTGVFASSCCYDQSKYLGGIALNLRMHPSVLSNDEGLGKLRDITKDYFRHGGMEVQYNVVDTETLKDAQRDPDAHRDLVVRIAGFSAYFIELAEDLQNDIISRNENVI